MGIQVELASIQDTVSNSMIGKMRLQFWRDAIKHISDVRFLPSPLCHLRILTTVFYLGTTQGRPP